MRMFSCENPRFIENPYTHEHMTVPCGKCNACRRSRASSWVRRLELERSCHPYCLFVTLTYSDEFLPKAYPFADSLITCDGQIVDFDDDDEHFDLRAFSPSDWEFASNPAGFGILRMCDVSKFIKRLRQQIKLYEKDRNCNYIRFYAVGEYGSTTYRPHYHLLIFTASKWFAENAKSVVAKCWSSDNRASDSTPFGLVDVQHVSSSASSYVASYLNSYTSLPKVLVCKSFRPKSLCSKRPPLGTLQIVSSEIQEIFTNCSPVFSQRDDKLGRFVDVPIPQQIENRLFPRIKAFDRISHSLRVTLYGLVQISEAISYQEFLDWLEERCNNPYFPNSECAPDYVRYCNKLLSSSEHALSRLYSIGRRVQLQSYLFGVSIRDYVSHIEQYYANKSAFVLNNYLSFQEEFSNKVHPIDDNFHSYFDLVFRKRHFNGDDKSYRDLPEYRFFVSDNLHYTKDKTYSKFKNDYLQSHGQTDFINLIFRLHGK